MLPAALILPALESEKDFCFPTAWIRQPIGSLNGVRECILLTVEISNLKRRILNS